MPRFQTMTAALLASTALAGAAQADVTAAQVWDGYRSLLAMDPSAEVSIGEETTEGDTLVLRDITVVTDQTTQDSYNPERAAHSSATVSYDELRFEENGDGTVTVSMVGNSRAVSRVEDGYGGSFEFDMTSSYEGYKDVVGGTPERMEHTMSFTSSMVEMTRLEIDEDVEMVDPIVFRATNGSGAMMNATTDEMLNFEGEMQIESLEGSGKVASADGSEGVAFSLAAGDLKFGFDMMMPAVLLSDPDSVESLPEEFDLVGRVDTGPLSITATAATEDGPVGFELTSSGEHLLFDMSPDGLVYEQSSKDVALGLQSTQLPFPVNLSGSEIGMALTFPFAADDSPRNARAAVFLDTISVNEEIWALLDFAGKLPHDPITVRADLSGMVNVLMDLTSEEAMMMDEPPIEPVSARIEELTVQGLGLNASGEGAVEFDLDDTQSYDGMPAPIGSLSFNIEGLNGLLDNLVAMGVIPEDQVMMGRMMLGAFTVPTGEDAVSTTIDLREGGQIFANGQRLQ